MVRRSRVARSCECGPRPTRESKGRRARRRRQREAQSASASPTAKILRRIKTRAALASAESTFHHDALLNFHPSPHGLEHAFHSDVHADPFRTRAPVAINAAVDVSALYADV